MVFVVGVDGPQVVGGAAEIFHSQHRGQHGVVLVIVLVHAVSADREEPRDRLEVAGNSSDVRLVVAGVAGVCARFADDPALGHFGGAGEAELLEFSRRQHHQCVVVTTPQIVAALAVVLNT